VWRVRVVSADDNREGDRNFLYGREQAHDARNCIRPVVVLPKARYDQACASRGKLDQLTEKSRVEKLSAQEMWQMAALTEAFRGVDAAVPLYQQILLKNDNHAPANFAIGRILLSRETSTVFRGSSRRWS
jgi:hypothetical protein